MLVRFYLTANMSLLGSCCKFILETQSLVILETDHGYFISEQRGAGNIFQTFRLEQLANKSG